MMNMQSIILNKVENYIKELLGKINSNGMYYHNYNHTLDVVKVSTEIALAEGIGDDDIEIIKIAAWFHDSGYLSCCEGHEKQSSIYAQKFLEKESYPENKIKKVTGCINATTIPQSPKNKIEEILCDADLHHLGTVDSEEKGKLLRKEIEYKELKKFSDLEWLKMSLQFLQHHKYFTDYAKVKFDEQKKLNILDLGNKLMLLERSKN